MPGSAAPGSASAEEYGGSRKLAQRFAYKDGSSAGFVELSPMHVWEGADLYKALSADPAVSFLQYNSTKASQGNRGDHYMEQNILVHMSGFPNKPVEFELTRHQHMKATAGRAFTVTACFKTPPPGMEEVAWQVLLRITRGKELCPPWVQEYARRSLGRAEVVRLARLVVDLGAQLASRGHDEGHRRRRPLPRLERRLAAPVGRHA